MIKYYLGFNTKKFFNVFKEEKKKMEEINETNEVYMEECEFPILKENGDIGEPMPRQGKLCGFGCFSGKVCGIGCIAAYYLVRVYYFKGNSKQNNSW